MTKQELEKMYLIKEGVVFTPQYTFSEYTYDEELDDHIYKDFTIIKTAQEVYEDNKIDICLEKTTEEKVEDLINQVTVMDEIIASLTLEVL